MKILIILFCAMILTSFSLAGAERESQSKNTPLCAAEEECRGDEPERNPEGEEAPLILVLDQEIDPDEERTEKRETRNRAGKLPGRSKRG